YDGFGRILGGLGSFGRGAAAGAGRVFNGGGAGGFGGPGGGGGGGGFGGAAGPLRLFNEQLGGEISWLLPLAAVAIAVGIWARRAEFAPGLGTLELALAVVAAVALLLPRMRGLLGRLPAAALVAGLVAVMLGPTSYALATAGRTQGSGDPRSGPATAAAAFGP